MAKKIVKKKKSGGTPFGVIGTAGTQNYVVKDTPCLIPRENINFFNNMRKNAGVSSFGNFPNPFNVFWKGAGK